MKGSDFTSDCADLLYYKCHKINFNYSRSNIDTPDWIKNKQTNKTTSSILIDDDKFFQYAATVALNHKKIGKNSERISKIIPLLTNVTGK